MQLSSETRSVGDSTVLRKVVAEAIANFGQRYTLFGATTLCQNFVVELVHVMSARIGRALPPVTLDLRDFQHRLRVRAQFRSFLRELRGLDVAPAMELRQRIRAEYAAKRGEQQRVVQRQHLAEGERQLMILRTFVGTARRSSVMFEPHESESSWVGTGDSWDVRGRVGDEWPWKS